MESGRLQDMVREHRARLGESQEAYAERVGVPKHIIRQLERGETKVPGADIRRKLATALGITHVDVLIAAGELTADEVRAAGVRPTSDAAAASVHAVVDRYEWDDETARAVIAIIGSVMALRSTEG